MRRYSDNKFTININPLQKLSSFLLFRSIQAEGHMLFCIYICMVEKWLCYNLLQWNRRQKHLQCRNLLLGERILNKLYNQYPDSRAKLVGCSLTIPFFHILSTWLWIFQTFIQIIITVIVSGLWTWSFYPIKYFIQGVSWGSTTVACILKLM